MAAIEVWRKRVAEWRASGQSAARFCELRSFSAVSLYGWARRIGPRANDERAAIQLARVERVVDASPAARADITVELSGARVRVPAGADAATVAVVLRTLRAEVQR